MDIKLYNSLTNKLEIFKPIIPGEVSMYVCGSTVYDSPHIGNFRPIVSFDVLRRLFKYLGYKVTYVSNFTDVDDKIINRALKENVDEMSISNRYIKEIKENIVKINSLLPDITPRVSEYMDKIISFVDDLVKSKHAYILDNDVYFKVDSIKGYGELSNVNIDELKIGARIEDVKGKISPLDFALWKKTDVGIKWDSPWSKGRPGWHTECCVMIDSIFKNKMIDIHGGGFDLKFPHHENEIAQNKALYNNKLANYWIHNGFVTFGSEKMSKSIGNVILAKDAINEYGGNVIRLALLSSHYRAPVKINKDTLEMAKSEINKIETTYSKVAVFLQKKRIDIAKDNKGNIGDFIKALCDDLNVSNALTILYNALKESNNLLRSKDIDSQLYQHYINIKDMLSLLGIKIDYPILKEDDFLMLKEYENARLSKDYKKSDELRKILIKRYLI